MIMPESEIRYIPGESFKCFKRPTISPDGEMGPACGADIVMHGYWWCAQVCPACLANYCTTHSGDPALVGLDTAGFYPSDLARKVREEIAANGVDVAHLLSLSKGSTDRGSVGPCSHP